MAPSVSSTLLVVKGTSTCTQTLASLEEGPKQDALDVKKVACLEATLSEAPDALDQAKAGYPSTD